MAVFEDGAGPHSHQISSSTPIRTGFSNAFADDINGSIYPITVTPKGDVYILGSVDVGIDGQKVWENVNANITISEE